MIKNTFNKYSKGYKEVKDKISQRFNQAIKDQYKNSKIKFNTSKKVLSEKISTINWNLGLEKLQDKVESSFSRDPNDVILTQSRYWARAITWVLISGTGFGVVWLCTAKTDQIVVALGKLEPITKVVDIQMPIQGVTEELLVNEGQTVMKGDVLIKLDTDISKAKKQALTTALAVNKEILDGLKMLVEEGGVSKIQYLEQLNKVSDLEGQLIQNSVTLKYQEIVAPITGTIFDLQPKGKGYVGNSGETLMKIVPSDNLHAKVEIDSRRIGFVSIGKKADISIDSFPSNDFGVIEGTITKISSDALPPDPSFNKNYRFPVTIKLNEQTLKLKNGKRLSLQPGMSLTANIKLRKTTYIQLLLNKFQDKADSLKAL